MFSTRGDVIKKPPPPYRDGPLNAVAAGMMCDGREGPLVNARGGEEEEEGSGCVYVWRRDELPFFRSSSAVQSFHLSRQSVQ